MWFFFYQWYFRLSPAGPATSLGTYRRLAVPNDLKQCVQGAGKMTKTKQQGLQNAENQAFEERAVTLWNGSRRRRIGMKVTSSTSRRCWRQRTEKRKLVRPLQIFTITNTNDSFNFVPVVPVVLEPCYFNTPPGRNSFASSNQRNVFPIYLYNVYDEGMQPEQRRNTLACCCGSRQVGKHLASRTRTTRKKKVHLDKTIVIAFRVLVVILIVIVLPKNTCTKNCDRPLILWRVIKLIFWRVIKLKLLQSNSAEVSTGVRTDKKRNFWRHSGLLPNGTENFTQLTEFFIPI